MIKVVGVRFRSSGKVYYFDPGELELKPGAHVLVETVRGLEYGTVAGAPREVEDDRAPQPLRTVVRAASAEDEQRAASDREKEKEAIAVCKEKIRAHGLEMKLIDAEYTFDHNKILFYFTADGRIDFRELVKDLASVFRTRIELRQIGVRDETKMLGGIGICGRPLCCHTYLSDFTPVSIKMAKEQNLSLNPSKISGVCGRLMCCLKNEEATYEYLNSLLPSVGDVVETPDGLQGEVSEVNVLRQRVRVLVEEDDEKEIHEYGAGELKMISHHARGRRNNSHSRENRNASGRSPAAPVGAETQGEVQAEVSVQEAQVSVESAQGLALQEQMRTVQVQLSGSAEPGKRRQPSASRPSGGYGSRERNRVSGYAGREKERVSGKDRPPRRPRPVKSHTEAPGNE